MENLSLDCAWNQVITILLVQKLAIRIFTNGIMKKVIK